MDYLKNRQKVITDGIRNMKRSTLTGVPVLISESKYGRSAIKADKAVDQKFKKVQGYGASLLLNPRAYDNVYRTATKLFDSNHAWNLKRPNALRFKIRNLARKRFVLGYPPRKPDDTSIGDAINWEWIVHCAAENELKPNILLVSRDADYGITSGETAVLNDLLKAEFKMRVGNRRKIVLTNKLTVALRKLDEVVTSADEEAEKIVLSGPSISFGGTGIKGAVDPALWSAFLNNFSPSGPRIPLPDDDGE